jgi:hypothetical protein
VRKLLWQFGAKLHSVRRKLGCYQLSTTGSKVNADGGRHQYRSNIGVNKESNVPIKTCYTKDSFTPLMFKSVVSKWLKSKCIKCSFSCQKGMLLTQDAFSICISYRQPTFTTQQLLQLSKSKVGSPHLAH